MTDTPANHGRSWDLDDYETLVSSMRDALSLDEAADVLERTPGAVAARAEFLIRGASPDASQRNKDDHYYEAQERLSEDEYDWMEALQENLDAAGLPLWDVQSDSVLRAAWTESSPRLDALAETFGVTVASVVRRIVDIGLGETAAEVRTRFGEKPRRTKEPTRPWILIITTENGNIWHLNRHYDLWEAAVERDAHLPSPDEAVDASVKWRWEIVTGEDPDQIPHVCANGHFHPRVEITLGPDFVEEQLRTGDLTTIWGALEGPAAPVVMCRECTETGLWNVAMHALAAESQIDSELTRVYFRCLRGHIDDGLVDNDAAGDWLGRLPYLPNTAGSAAVSPVESPAVSIVEESIQRQVRHDDDDVDISDEDLPF
ncbi:hypothetical protein M0655_02835 [Gordonia amicalis]|uniref:hypothetical protein n=1 Tax=Gordonia amicalis TaxID=89053 RepID=UPI00200B9888|nr:hypothetical protein [Gordonia amicalis]UPW14568.1 hypothetical protein M0655_02835 [Gordonia amicalis]